MNTILKSLLNTCGQYSLSRTKTFLWNTRYEAPRPCLQTHHICRMPLHLHIYICKYIHTGAYDTCKIFTHVCMQTANTYNFLRAPRSCLMYESRHSVIILFSLNKKYLIMIWKIIETDPFMFSYFRSMNSSKKRGDSLKYLLFSMCTVKKTKSSHIIKSLNVYIFSLYFDNKWTLLCECVHYIRNTYIWIFTWRFDNN